MSGLIISLSIAFFIVAGCAGILNACYHSFQQASFDPRNSEKLIDLGPLAQLVPTQASAAELESKAQPVKDTHYISLTQNQSTTQTIKLKNIGKDIWKSSEVTIETGPSLRSFSKLKTDSWRSYYQPIRLVRDIKPGGIAEITFPIKAPTDIDGTIQENFQLVKKERPLPGSLVRLFVTIKPVASAKVPIVVQNTPKVIVPQPATVNLCLASAPVSSSEYNQCNTSPSEPASQLPVTQITQGEPIIRVGLFAATIPQRISFDSNFNVVAGTETLFSGVSGQPAIISFDPASRRYTVTVADSTKLTVSPVRLVPQNANGVATLLDYKNAPAWNVSLSDNRYRGVIEIRYTEPAKKIWVINELPMESYLKGLAETSNASGVEFQKVIATAARSYALYHYLRGLSYGLTDASTKHSADHFYVDAYYDQVYRGYNSEIRLPKLFAAVEATRGVAVSYNNQPVITPYFSNSDGRTRDWTEVWYGSGQPWLKSVLVPEDNGQTLFGHGVGLSARGALLMTNAGKSWQDVLKYFYAGSDIMRIY